MAVFRLDSYLGIDSNYVTAPGAWAARTNHLRHLGVCADLARYVGTYAAYGVTPDCPFGARTRPESTPWRVARLFPPAERGSFCSRWRAHLCLAVRNRPAEYETSVNLRNKPSISLDGS